MSQAREGQTGPDDDGRRLVGSPGRVIVGEDPASQRPRKGRAGIESGCPAHSNYMLKVYSYILTNECLMSVWRDGKINSGSEQDDSNRQELSEALLRQQTAVSEVFLFFCSISSEFNPHATGWIKVQETL